MYIKPITKIVLPVFKEYSDHKVYLNRSPNISVQLRYFNNGETLIEVFNSNNLIGENVIVLCRRESLDSAIEAIRNRLKLAIVLEDILEA